jgi:hypothetical protein
MSLSRLQSGAGDHPGRRSILIGAASTTLSVARARDASSRKFCRLDSAARLRGFRAVPPTLGTAVRNCWDPPRTRVVDRYGWVGIVDRPRIAEHRVTTLGSSCSRWRDCRVPSDVFPTRFVTKDERGYQLPGDRKCAKKLVHKALPPEQLTRTLHGLRVVRVSSLEVPARSRSPHAEPRL